MNDIGKKFGARLRVIRKEKKLTQDQLGTLIDRSVDAISNLERGLSLPSFETLMRLSEQLDIPIKELFDFELAGQDENRAELMNRLQAIGRDLTLEDLNMAVEQIGAIKKRAIV